MKRKWITVRQLTNPPIVKPISSIEEHPNYPKQTIEHSSLHDARFNRDLYNFLKTL